MLLLAGVQELGGDGVTEADHVGGRIRRRVHGGDPGVDLLRSRADVLGIEVVVLGDAAPVTTVAVERRDQHIGDGVLVVGVVGGDHPHVAPLPVEVLGGVLVLGEAHHPVRILPVS